jgi:hypothetical protein
MKIGRGRILGIVVLAVAGAVAAGGCKPASQSGSAGAPGPAERTGAALDKAAEKTSDAAQRTATATKEAAGRAVEKTGEALEKAGTAVENAGEKMQK